MSTTDTRGHFSSIIPLAHTFILELGHTTDETAHQSSAHNTGAGREEDSHRERSTKAHLETSKYELIKEAAHMEAHVHAQQDQQKLNSLTRILPGAWSARGLLTPAEAEDLQSEALKHDMLHVEAGRNGESLTDARLRDCTRVSLQMQDLADRVFARLKPYLPTQVVVDNTEESRLIGLPYGDYSLCGLWRPCGVNPHFRVCKYPGDGRGHFGPHQDSAVTLSKHRRSLLTLNGYLNALPEGLGGCTRFLIDECPLHKDERGRFTVEDPSTQVRASIRPEAPGHAAIFYHGLMHDSEPLREGAPPKWIWRTEVLFERDPASAPASDPITDLVCEIERAAERIEREDAMRSMQIYQLAQRLKDGRVSVHAARSRLAALKPDEYEAADIDTDTEEREEHDGT